MRQYLATTLIYAALLGVFTTADALGSAPPEIVIDGAGDIGAVPIAIVPFAWQGPGPRPGIGAIIAADLQRSGRFFPVNESNLPAQPHSGDDIEFANWKTFRVSNMPVEAIVIGQIKSKDEDHYEVLFQLFDIFQGEQIIGYKIPASRKEFRQTAHLISDMIYEKLTGQQGDFSTRIAYVTAAGENKNRRYSLQIADADGYNPRTMVRSKEPLMSPAWSPDGSKLAYVSFEKRGSSIFVQELATGKRQQISSVKGINGAPAWSPDGSKLALTLSYGRNPDIYIMTLATKALRRLSTSYAIDTEPVWSPDSKTIVFTSDRGGKPQLYKVSVHGGAAKRITFEGNYNARASFSSDGSHIAMVHSAKKGQFQIAVMALDTNDLRVLTSGSLDESPSFSPNGTMIIYASTEGGRGGLSAVSVNGGIHQRYIFEEGSVREPAWSPLSKN